MTSNRPSLCPGRRPCRSPELIFQTQSCLWRVREDQTSYGLANPGVWRPDALPLAAPQAQLPLCRKGTVSGGRVGVTASRALSAWETGEGQGAKRADGGKGTQVHRADLESARHGPSKSPSQEGGWTMTRLLIRSLKAGPEFTGEGAGGDCGHTDPATGGQRGPPTQTMSEPPPSAPAPVTAIQVTQTGERPRKN